MNGIANIANSTATDFPAGGSGIRPVLRSAQTITMPFKADPQLQQEVQAYKSLEARRKSIPEDHLLATQPNLFTLGLKTIFVNLPKTLLKGLRGDADFNFADSMLLSKVPYYIGGVMLTLMMTGNKYNMLRQGVAVGLYLLGESRANAFINHLYKARYGVNLDERYETKTGQIEKMYASAEFPRFDLLKPEDYEQMADVQGVPKSVIERDGAVRENMRYMIANSRTLKIVVGHLLSAIGAGYLARTDSWMRVPATGPILRNIWHSQDKLFSKIYRLTSVSLAAIRQPTLERAGSVTLLAGASLALTAWYIWFHGIPPKKYETVSDTSASPQPIPWGYIQTSSMAMTPFRGTQAEHGGNKQW